jgi:hypothetical protein
MSSQLWGICCKETILLVESSIPYSIVLANANLLQPTHSPLANLSPLICAVGGVDIVEQDL